MTDRKKEFFESVKKILSDNIFRTDIRLYLNGSKRPDLDSNSSLDGLKVLVFDDIDLADWDEALRCVESYEQQYTKKSPTKKKTKIDRADLVLKYENDIRDIARESWSKERKLNKIETLVKEFETYNNEKSAKDWGAVRMCTHFMLTFLPSSHHMEIKRQMNTDIDSKIGAFLQFGLLS